MVTPILNFPSDVLRAVGRKIGNMSPSGTVRRVENFVNNRSWVTRTLAKASVPAAILYVGSGPVGLLAAGVGALITGRAIGVDNLWTGQKLPKEPKAALLETAHTLAIYESRNTRIASPSQSSPSGPASEIGMPSVDKAAQMRITDHYLQAFIQNASIATNITLVHTGCLGHPIDPVVMPKIILEASAPNANLWDVYTKYLGKNLSTLDWLRAHFWFFLTYSLGVIPNSVNTFMTNVLKEGRKNFSDPTQIVHLDQMLRNVLDQVSSFLDVYNGATKAYANAVAPTGDVDSYRRAAIEQFSGKSLDTLTQEFCTTLVDQFFPHIPFFETLKQYPLIGWVFTILDYLIGGVINCLGRNILKCLLPNVAKQLIETGIDSTNPTNLPFSIAIANALTQLFIELENTPQAIAETPLLQPEKLPAVIEKFLDTVDLNGSRENPLNTQDKIKKQLDSMNNSWLHRSWWRGKKRNILREAMISSTHTFITHLTKNAEELFANVFGLLNSPFIETRQQTQTDYTNAMEGLDLAAQRAFHKLIHDFLQEAPIELQREFYEQLYAQYKTATDETIQQLLRCQQNLLAAQTTDRRIEAVDQYAQTLKHFTSNTSINQAPLAGQGVINAFYEAFHPFHKELPTMTTQLLGLQGLLQQHQRNHTVGDHLAQIDATLVKLIENPEEHAITHATPDTLRQALDHIAKTSSPFTAEHLRQIHLQIDALEAMLGTLETNRQTKKQLDQQRASQQRYIAPPWLTRAPSLAKLMKGTPVAEIDRLREAAEQEHTQTLDQLQRTIAQFRTHIAPMIGIQTPLTQQNSDRLNRQIRELQQKTVALSAINQSIQPARVEIHPFMRRVAHREIAKRGTPYAIDFFQKVLHFITMKDPYIASTRIGMKAVINAYGQKR